MKVNDWVIHNYEIKMIKKMEENRIVEVSSGYICCSSFDLTEDCRPLTLSSKVYADSFRRIYDKIHNLPDSNSFNFPDINRYLSDLCLKAIDSHKDGFSNDFVKQAENFYKSFKEAVGSSPKVDGVRIYR